SQVLYGASRRASTGAIHVAAGVPRTRVPEGRASSAERARLVRPQPRIQGVAEAVPEEVEAQDGEHDGGAGKEEDPPGAAREVLVGVGEHRAPLRRRGLGAEPEESEGRRL